MNTAKQAAEEANIRQVILDYYSEGHVKSDPLLYEEVLHPEWRFFLFDEHGQLRIVDRDEYTSWYDPDEVDPALVWETEFYSIDVAGDIAAVKLRLECQDVRYIDYFNMMRIDGRWWIVHKMSAGVDKRAGQG
jgi:hypothetical protein